METENKKKTKQDFDSLVHIIVWFSGSFIFWQKKIGKKSHNPFSFLYHQLVRIFF